MKLRILIAVLIFTSYSFCNAQQAQIIKWNALENILQKKSDTTYVVNFWATWCKPCVAELPYFLQTEKELSNKAVKFLFISMDFKKDFSSRLIPFLVKEKINSSVYLLDEPDYNSWMDKVDSTWGGGIPATLIFNHANSKRGFYEKDFAEGELEQTLNPYIQ